MASSRIQKDKECATHPDEPLKFYCTSHNIIVCSVCAVKLHKQCNDVLTFSEAIERFEREDKNLFKALENQSNAIELTISAKNNDLGYLGENVEATKSEIGRVCDKLHGVINGKMEEMFKRVDELARDEERKIKDDIEMLHNLLISAERVQKHAEHAFEKKSALSIIKSMVGVQNVYCDIDRSRERIKDKEIQRLSFQKSDTVKEVFENVQTLGFISLSKFQGIRETDAEAITPILAEPEVKFVRFAPEVNEEPLDERISMKELDFNFIFDENETSTEDDMDDSEEPMTSGDDNDVTKRADLRSDIPGKDEVQITEATVATNRVKEETVSKVEIVRSLQALDHVKPCWLYGIAFLSGERLAITDVAHDTVQLFDDAGKVMSEKKVSFTPWDIATVDGDRVAVSAGGRGSVHLFDVKNNELRSQQILNIGYDCICLSYVDKVFTVGTRAGVAMVTGKEQTVTKIDTCAENGESLRRTDFVTMDSRNDKLFLTNTWRNKVLSMTAKGQRIWEFQGQGHNPRGICWHEEKLFVCSRNQGKILVLNDNGELVREMASGLIDFPYAIAHHASGKMVAVTQWDVKIGAEDSRTIKIVKYQTYE